MHDQKRSQRPADVNICSYIWSCGLSKGEYEDVREGIREEVGDRAAYASIFGLLKPYCSKHLVTYIPYIFFQ